MVWVQLPAKGIHPLVYVSTGDGIVFTVPSTNYYRETFD